MSTSASATLGGTTGPFDVAGNELVAEKSSLKTQLNKNRKTKSMSRHKATENYEGIRPLEKAWA